jgi:acid phosphatase
MKRIAVVCLLLAAPAPAPALARPRAVVPPGNGIADVKRVFVVVLENENYDIAVAQPELASLAGRGALLGAYYAITHPSQPNYLALVGGATFVTHSNPVTLPYAHLGDLLEARGLQWKTYAEGYPGGCFLGASLGAYVRRHVPFLNFEDVQNDQARCTRIVPAAQLDLDLGRRELPNFALYVPDLNHDGHDTGVAVADAWLRTRFEPLLANPDFMDGMLFIVVFDEGRTTGTNRIYCAFLGAGVRRGSVSFTPYDHYDLLRTIEEIFHTGTLHRMDEAAKGIGDVWNR